MTNFLKGFGLVGAGIVVGLLFTLSTGLIKKDDSNVGGIYNQVKQYFYGGIEVGTTGQFAVSAAGAVTSAGDLTVSGGTLSVPTTANATSTIIGGCIQTYATSSATSIKLVMNTVASSTGNGFVLWQYGTCPSL